MLEVRLRVLGGKHEGKMIPLPPGKFLIGRERDCHLRPSSELVSRHHCVFYVDQYAVRLRDLGSRNGTIVNNDRLEGEATLRDGDRIRIGALEFQAVLREVDQPAKVPTGVGQVVGDSAVLSTGETHYELPTDAATVPPATGGTTAPPVKLPPPPQRSSV